MILRYKQPLTKRIRPVRNQCGFTLAEMLVVLAILSTVSVVVFPHLAGREQLSRVEKVENSLVSLLRQAREKAMITNQSEVIIFNPDERQFSISADKKVFAAPNGITVSFITATKEISQGLAKIRFFADGTSTGGCIKIALAKETRKICVSWLTGDIKRHNIESPEENN